MFKLAYRTMGCKPNQYTQCTPSWPSKADAIIAAKGLVERKLKEGNPVDCIVSKKLTKGSGEVVWDSERDMCNN